MHLVIEFTPSLSLTSTIIRWQLRPLGFPSFKQLKIPVFQLTTYWLETMQLKPDTECYHSWTLGILRLYWVILISLEQNGLTLFANYDIITKIVWNFFHIYSFQQLVAASTYVDPVHVSNIAIARHLDHCSFDYIKSLPTNNDDTSAWDYANTTCGKQPTMKLKHNTEIKPNDTKLSCRSASFQTPLLCSMLVSGLRTKCKGPSISP